MVPWAPVLRWQHCTDGLQEALYVRWLQDPGGELTGHWLELAENRVLAHLGALLGEVSTSLGQSLQAIKYLSIRLRC